VINQEFNSTLFQNHKFKKGESTGIAADVTGVPSMDTTPCRGVIYLLIMR